MKYCFLTFTLCSFIFLQGAEETITAPTLCKNDSIVFLQQQLHGQAIPPSVSSTEAVMMALVMVATQEVTYPVFKQLLGTTGGVLATSLTTLATLGVTGLSTERGRFLRTQKVLNKEILDSINKKTNEEEPLEPDQIEKLEQAQRILGKNHHLTTSAINPLLNHGQQ
jgi:hypothetical protein